MQSFFQLAYMEPQLVRSLPRDIRTRSIIFWLCRFQCPWFWLIGYPKVRWAHFAPAGLHALIALIVTSVEQITKKNIRTYLDTLVENMGWSQILGLIWDRPPHRTFGTEFFCQHHTLQSTPSKETNWKRQLGKYAEKC